MSLVEIKNLTKRFGDNLIWENINENIEKGDVIVIVGNSGCGKTTTLRIVGGFETPDEGEVYFEEFLEELIENNRHHHDN